MDRGPALAAEKHGPPLEVWHLPHLKGRDRSRVEVDGFLEPAENRLADPLGQPPMILLCREFAELTPRDISRENWQRGRPAFQTCSRPPAEPSPPKCIDEMLEELADDV